MENTREEKSRDAKLEEQTLKSLGNHSPEEKLILLTKKYVELEKENKKLSATIKQYEKRSEIILREKDNLQKEYNKGVLIKDKLEQVCREQQKLIKSVKNESLSKIREEEERRKENQAKFQQSFNEIHVTLNKNNDENNKLRDDNIEMSKKLKYLAEQYQTREKQLENITEQISLDTQLHETKLTKMQMEAAIEKEIVLREKQKALDELLNCKKLIQDMHSREAVLKDQVHLYTTKYDDFQNSLQKSNTIFSTYKVELEKLSKNSKKLQKENAEWRHKYEKSNAGLIELATEKQAKDEYVAKCAKQVNQLQKLLRTLQIERTTLHQVLKDNNIERPAVPILPAEPEPINLPPPPPQQKDKMDIMQKNCAELKQTLAKLQGQMNAITAKQTEVEKTSSVERDKTTSATTSNKKNKNKNKKNKNKTCPTKTKDNDDIEAVQIVENVSDKLEPLVEINTIVDLKLEETNEAKIEEIPNNELTNTDVPIISKNKNDMPMNLESLVAAVLMEKYKSKSLITATQTPEAEALSTVLEFQSTNSEENVKEKVKEEKEEKVKEEKEEKVKEVKEEKAKEEQEETVREQQEKVKEETRITEMFESSIGDEQISNDAFVVVNQSDTVEMISEN